MLLQGKEFFDKGKRGLVYTAVLDGRKVLVKERNPSADVDTVEHEALMLRKLNELGIGPRFIAFEDDSLVREFVDGQRIEEFLADASALEAKVVVREVLRQCRVMDEAGINKFEMTHPYKHILVSKADSSVQNTEDSSQGSERGLSVVMIDFERCRFSQRPKNVTQVCQYLARISSSLHERGVSFDADEVLGLGEEYKRQG